MASLRAMLAAQAKGDASRVANEKEMEIKQHEIDRLEKRVAQLEEELEQKKVLIQQIEAKMKSQKENAAAELNKLQHQVHHLNTNHSHRRNPTPPSPGGHRGASSPTHSKRKTADSDTSLPSLAEDMVSAEMLAEHKAQVRRLEEELEAERRHRRAADGEIIKLRAAMGGVQLSDSDVNALLPDAMESLAPAQAETIEEGEEEEEERLDERYVMFGPILRGCLFTFHGAVCVSRQSHWVLVNYLQSHDTQDFASILACVIHWTEYFDLYCSILVFHVHNTQKRHIDICRVCCGHLCRCLDSATSCNGATNAYCLESIC